MSSVRVRMWLRCARTRARRCPTSPTRVSAMLRSSGDRVEFGCVRRVPAGARPGPGGDQFASQLRAVRVEAVPGQGDRSAPGRIEQCGEHRRGFHPNRLALRPRDGVQTTAVSAPHTGINEHKAKWARHQTPETTRSVGPARPSAVLTREVLVDAPEQREEPPPLLLSLEVTPVALTAAIDRAALPSPPERHDHARRRRPRFPHGLCGSDRVPAPELIGTGGSDKPGIAYRFTDHAEHLDAWIEASATWPSASRPMASGGAPHRSRRSRCRPPGSRRDSSPPRSSRRRRSTLRGLNSPISA